MGQKKHIDILVVITRDKLLTVLLFPKFYTFDWKKRLSDTTLGEKCQKCTCFLAGGINFEYFSDEQN